MLNKIYFYDRQYVDQQDIDAVKSSLQSDWVINGTRVEEFENSIAEKMKVVYCAAVCNGTATLPLSGLALGLKKDDIITTFPITFLASAV